MAAQGFVAGAKEDTVALFRLSDFSVDLSQHATPLVSASLGGYLVADSLRAIDGASGRELYLRIDYASPMKGKVLLAHADPASLPSNTWAIVTNGASTIEFVQGSTLLHTLVPPDPCDLSIGWFTRPNPDTTSASDALISDIVAYNHSLGVWLEPTQVVHAIPSTSAAWATHVGGFWDGATWTAESGQITTLRIGTAPDHSSVEMGEDFVAARDAPTSDTSPIEPLLLVPAELGGEGEWAGSANVGGLAEQARRMRRRTWSPLVSEVMTDPGTMTSSFAPAQWFRLMPGSLIWRARLDLLRWVPVPPDATHAWVRVHVRSWVTTGDAVPIGVRVFSMNRPPSMSLAKYPTAPTFELGAVESQPLLADHGPTGIGEWVTFPTDAPGALLRLRSWTPKLAGFEGTTHIGIAVAFDPLDESANVANARLQIRAWHVIPTSKFVGQGLD